jgi:tetratricopeptide (TPR) repeat protein
MRFSTIRPSNFFVSSAFVLCCASASVAAETPSPDLKKSWILVHGSQLDNLRAQKEAAAALKKNSKSAEWHELLAMACLTTDIPTAMAESQKALSLAPTSARFMTSYAIVCLHALSYPQAVTMASRALKLDPRNGRAYAVLATYFFQKNNDDEAQRQFSKALQLSPNDFDVNVLASDFYAKTLKQKETQACVERLVAKFPSSSRAHALMGKFRNDSNDPAGAAKEFEIAANLDAENGYAFNKLAKALAQIGKYKEAVAACNHYVELHPTRGAYFLRAGFLAGAGQLQKALDDYNKVIAFAQPKPGDVNPDGDNGFRLREYKICLIKRMELNAKLGHTDIAIAEANEMLKADSRSDVALQFREQMFRKQGRYLEALTDLNRLIEFDQDVPDWYKARADVYAKLNKPDLAAADLAKAKHVEAFGK